MVGYKGGKFYEIFVDNTILFLEQIDRNKDIYNSIFDSPILSAFKGVHDQYGTVFTFCLFWEVDTGCVSAEYVTNEEDRNIIRVGWNLSSMTDKFKSEFQANSNWLRFNYHCWGNDTVYEHTSRNLGDDYALTKTEVLRFAGVESWIDFRSKMHWYSCTATQQQQLRSQNVKVVVFPPQHTGYNGYSCTDEFKQKVFSQGESYRSDTDLVYSVSAGRIENIVLNNDNLGVGAPMNMYNYFNEYTARIHDDWKQNPYMLYMSVETHEYCYWWNASVFQGYYDTGKWMSENGYKPGFYEYHLDDGLKYNWITPSFT